MAGPVTARVTRIHRASATAILGWSGWVLALTAVVVILIVTLIIGILTAADAPIVIFTDREWPAHRRARMLSPIQWADSVAQGPIAHLAAVGGSTPARRARRPRHAQEA